MANKKLSRRDFLRMSGASAAMLAAGVNLPGALQAAALKQDVTNIVFGGWGATAEDNGVQAAIAEFMKQNPNIAVQWQLTPQAADYMQQLADQLRCWDSPGRQLHHVRRLRNPCRWWSVDGHHGSHH